MIILLMFSCNNKESIEEYVEKPLSDEFNSADIDVKTIFDKLNQNVTQEKLPLGYYKNKILEDETSRRYLELNEIMEVEYLIPGFLCFIVLWTDFEGYVYKLYTFNDTQRIINIYDCGNGWPFPYSTLLTQNIPGNKLGNFLFVSDINNDGLNEIITFSFWHFSSVAIYGFDVVENKFKAYLETEYYFNYDEPFSPIKVENNNGDNEIIILKIVDKETYDLQWTKYIFDKEGRIYIIKN